MSEPQDAARYERVKDIVGEALLRDDDERQAYLEAACADDTELAAQVHSLLGYRTQAAGMLGEAARAELVGQLGDVPEPALEAPARIGPFRILRRLATGGMGTVFEAEQDQPQRRVALKLLRGDLLTPALLRRFERETEILGRLQHPGIAQVYEAGTADLGDGPRPWFSMEFVEGVPLGDHANRQDLDTESRLQLFARVCDAVEHAHTQGVVHRDLKPDNILVTAEGLPKVLDFGVARASGADVQALTVATEVGQIMGTLPYMSPEQAAGRPDRVDGRSDVYALGVILYELLAGKRPHDLRHLSLTAAVRTIEEQEATRLGALDTRYRGDVDVIVGKALEKDPARRYATAAELAADVRRHLRHEPIRARPASRWYLAAKFARRRRGLVVGLAVAALALIGGAALAARFAVLEAASAEQARRSAYRSALTVVTMLLDDDPMRAADELAATEPDQRGFEWELLTAETDVVLAEHPAPDGPGLGFDVFLRANKLPTSVARRGDGALIGARLTTDGDGVELIDMLGGAVLSTFAAEGTVVRPLLSADGSTLVARTRESGFRVWDVATGRLLVVERDAPFHQSLALSSDGARIGWYAADLRLHALHLATGERRAWPPPEKTGLAQKPLTFSRDGARLLHQDGWHDLDSGDQRSWDEPLGDRIPDAIPGVIAARDGDRLAVGLLQGSLVLTGEGGSDPRILPNAHRNGLTGLVHAADGSRLWSSSIYGDLATWDVASGERLVAAPLPRPLYDLALSADATLLAGGGFGGLLLTTAESHARRRLVGHTSYVYGSAFSPDGRLVASAAWDDTVRLWDALTGRALGVIEIPVVSDDPGHPRSLWFSPDGQRLCVGMHDVQLLFDAVTLRLAEDPRPGSALRVDDGWLYVPRARYSTWAEGQSWVIDVSGRRSLGFEQGDATLRSLAIDPDGGEVAIPFSADITAVDQSPHGQLLAVGTRSGDLLILDQASGAERQRVRAHRGEVHSVQFHPDGERLATGGRDGALSLWRANPLEPLVQRVVHDSYVYAVAFSPDGRQLVAGSGDTTLSLWTARPAREWFADLQEVRRLREAARPDVERRLAELGDAQALADALRRDPALDEASREAALFVLRQLVVDAEG